MQITYTQNLIAEKIILNIPSFSKIKKERKPLLPLNPPKKLSIIVKKPIAQITKINPFTNKLIIKNTSFSFIYYYIIYNFT